MNSSSSISYPSDLRSLTFLRFLAISIIVLFHFLVSFFPPIFFLSRLGNLTFFGLSAILIGKKWHDCNNPLLGRRFLTHRIVKMMPAYYLFLLGVFLLVTSTEGHLSGKTIALHIAFLPILSEITGFGHLWFLSVIVICYILYCGITWLNAQTRGYLLAHKFCVSLIAFILLTVPYFYAIAHLPFNICSILIGSSILFLYTGSILYSNSRLTDPCCLGIASAGLLAYNFLPGSWQKLAWLCLMASVFSIIFFLIRKESLWKYPLPRWIVFISSISFELYLCHHAFCTGPYALSQVIRSPILLTATFLAVSLLIASLLHFAAGKIQIFFKKRFNRKSKEN